MYNSSLHNASRSLRRMITATLTAVYLLITLSPLSSIAMHSKVVAHAVTGECSGDCNICGCSAENRANHTCCCAKKRQQQAHVHEDDEDGAADCCKKKPVKKKTVIACGCPCGSGKQAVLSASGTSEVLPFHFTEQFKTPHTETTFTDPTQQLTSRFGDPPDPPPKLSTRS
jgi:hypothetical protein